MRLRSKLTALMAVAAIVLLAGLALRMTAGGGLPFVPPIELAPVDATETTAPRPPTPPDSNSPTPTSPPSASVTTVPPANGDDDDHGDDEDGDGDDDGGDGGDD